MPSRSQSALRPAPTTTVGLTCRCPAGVGEGLAAGRASGTGVSGGAVGFEATATGALAEAGVGLGLLAAGRAGRCDVRRDLAIGCVEQHEVAPAPWELAAGVWQLSLAAGDNLVLNSTFT